MRILLWHVPGCCLFVSLIESRHLPPLPGISQLSPTSPPLNLPCTQYQINIQQSNSNKVTPLLQNPQWLPIASQYSSQSLWVLRALHNLAIVCHSNLISCCYLSTNITVQPHESDFCSTNPLLRKCTFPQLQFLVKTIP